MTWGSILVSAVLAGIVATAVTVAIEKWGGLIGGLLGTVPSTIVPAAVGMHLAGGEEALMASMSVVPLGMLLNALFLGAWLVLPVADLARHAAKSAASGTSQRCWCCHVRSEGSLTPRLSLTASLNCCRKKDPPSPRRL